MDDEKKDAIGLINWGEFRLNFSNYNDGRRLMTHKCNYDVLGQVIGIVGTEAKCSMCGRKLDVWEIERRLNAVERLSAENAEVMASGGHYGLNPSEAQMLDAYARALEGSDA